ncbi:MAG: hypothetical protein ACTSVA_06930 [Candidatus Njordarchaeales archaeon]
MSKTDSVKVFFRCPVCNRSINYVLSSEDLEKTDLTGVCDVAFDHGDHILLLFIDKNGDIRGWRIYKKEIEAKIAEEPGVWHRVNSRKYELLGISLLVADIQRKRYSDAFWHLDLNLILRYLEVTDDIVFVKISEEEVLIYPIDVFRYVVSNITESDLGGVIRFLNIITEMFGETVIDSLQIQKIIIATLLRKDFKLIFDMAIDLLRDLKAGNIICIRKDLFPLINLHINKYSNLLNKAVLDFFRKTPEKIGVTNLIDLVPLNMLPDFIIQYYRMKKLKLIEVI